jgi:hypothetical protein
MEKKKRGPQSGQNKGAKGNYGPIGRALTKETEWEIKSEVGRNPANFAKKSIFATAYGRRTAIGFLQLYHTAMTMKDKVLIIN